MSGPGTAIDLLGIKPIGEALRDSTNTVLTGAGAFLGRICLPVSEEFGLLLRDWMRSYRLGNIASTLSRAEAIMATIPGAEEFFAHPRVVMRLLEEASWTDNSELHEMWAGLLASSCSTDGEDESNLPFIAKLRDMTPAQCRLLRYACEHAPKRTGPGGLIYVESDFQVPLEKLFEVSGHKDIHRLAADLDHLRSLELIEVGFLAGGHCTHADLHPSALGVYLYVRASGSRESPPVFFDLNDTEYEVSEE